MREGGKKKRPREPPEPLRASSSKLQSKLSASPFPPPPDFGVNHPSVQSPVLSFSPPGRSLHPPAGNLSSSLVVSDNFDGKLVISEKFGVNDKSVVRMFTGKPEKPSPASLAAKKGKAPMVVEDSDEIGDPLSSSPYATSSSKGAPLYGASSSSVPMESAATRFDLNFQPSGEPILSSSEKYSGNVGASVQSTGRVVGSPLPNGAVAGGVKIPPGGFGAKKGTPASSGKKLKIKAFKEKPKLPENFEELMWTKIQNAIRAIHSKCAVECSLEELYRAVEDICVHRFARNLYDRIRQECDRHVGEQIRQLSVRDSTDFVVFLSHVATTWQDHCEQMLLIRNVALYLDRTFVLHCQQSAAGSAVGAGDVVARSSGSGFPEGGSIQVGSVREERAREWEGLVLSLWDMGLFLLRKHLSGSGEVERKIVEGLLSLIEKERMGETVDRGLLKHLLFMFTALGTYVESFEKLFLQVTSEFYSAEGERFLQSADVADYMKHVEFRIHEENERCFTYLDVSTRKSLISMLEKKLLERHIQTIVDKGFASLMDAHRVEDLSRMYTLLGRVARLEPLKLALCTYIKCKGQGIVMDEEREGAMVSSLLELKERLDSVWERAFLRDETFANAAKDAFEAIVNMRQNRPAELIAKFVDEKLKSGTKGISDAELEGTLDKVLLLFRFIQGKDVFEAFYKKDLAKRLLHGRSASVDSEKAMIARLKSECGSQFTNKLEGMFKDIELSEEINESFKQSSIARLKLPTGIDMSVQVLTTGYWPTYPPSEVRMPQELHTCQEAFKEFYLSKHSGRRLMWQNFLGHCLVRATFPKGKKELQVSLFQAVVILLFNDLPSLYSSPSSSSSSSPSPRFSFSDIRDRTGIEEKELKRTLQSLACGKLRVLNKIPKGRDVDGTDQFEVNEDFSAPLFRIKINAIQMKETAEENVSTTERVFQDRQYQVDAAIVRIMKTRKVLSHALLISELFQQLKFPIKPADLKKRIESLIDREYLERDKSSPQVYNYLA